MFNFMLAVAIVSVALVVFQFYAYFNWYKKPPQKDAQRQARKPACAAAHLKEGVGAL